MELNMPDWGTEDRTHSQLWRIHHTISVDHSLNRGGAPQFLDNHYHIPSNFLKLPQQLSIWIFMPHRSDV